MELCDRCKDVAGASIMSMFNQDTLCMSCKDYEAKHPDFERAREEERKAVLNGWRNYPGIGLLEDKRPTFIYGDTVRVTGWDGDWVIANILFEENGMPRDKPYQLRSTRRDDSEGHPTSFGTMPHESEARRYVWIWASADEMQLLSKASVAT